jgi:hypothetical protein
MTNKEAAMDPRTHAQQPSEGDRELIERELDRQSGKIPSHNKIPPHNKSRPATESDITRLIGETDAATVTAILTLHPSVEELTEAVAWTYGDGDILGKQGCALDGKVSDLFDIISTIEPPEEP